MSTLRGQYSRSAVLDRFKRTDGKATARIVMTALCGVVMAGCGSKKDAALTETLTIPATAVHTDARANIRSAVRVMGAVHALKGTYVGVTTQYLRQLDGRINPSTSLHDLSATSYCIESTLGSLTASYSGPGGRIRNGPCP
jgi:hypothetical protein